MKVVYLAGPYRSDTEFGVHQNIQRAEQLALDVWRLGAACICPQKNTAYFGGVLPDSAWLDGDKELIRRSDAVLLADGWADSRGATAERSFAEEIGCPVFDSISALQQWMQQQQ